MKTKQPLYKRLLALLLSVCMMCGVLPLAASALEVDAGTGTENNPIPIRTAQEFKEIAGLINSGALTSVLDLPAGATVYYRLEADISLAEYASGDGWTPIGNEDSPFEGHFDGNGHTVSGMQILTATAVNGYYGLFGVIGQGGSVSALRIADSRIELRDNTAGLLAGKSAGVIENCETGGTVKARNAGGLTGELSGGTVKTCLVTARVTGSNAAGGLYAAGAPDTLASCAVLSPEISGKTGQVYALGPDARDKAKTCIAWDKMGGAPDFGGADAKSADALKDAHTWQAVGDGAFIHYPWAYAHGSLPSLTGTAQPLPGYMTGKLAGFGTEGYPYTISTLDDLALFAEMVRSDPCQGVQFKLTADLDMAGYDYEERGKGWKPLPEFRGIFDGGGKAIKNLRINRPDEDRVGFFSEVRGDADSFGEDPNATYGIVRALGLENCDITGNAGSAPLVAYLHYGQVERCYTTGEMLGGRRFENPEEKDPFNDAMARTGGLVGEGWGIIRSCYSKANVRGVFAVGGIAGEFYGTLTDCYTTGDVTGDYGNSIGGILGADKLTTTQFSRCYSTSKVSSGPLLFQPTVFGNACGTGGIAGWTVGTATDLYALNPSVDSKSNRPQWVNKCVGYQTDYYGDNERLGGWIDTRVNGSEAGVTSAWDSYAESYKQSGVWRNFTDSGAWDMVDGRLPVLKDVGGPQDEGNPPVWLQDGYAGMYEEPKTEDGGKTYVIETPANLAWCSLNAEKLSNKTLDIRADLDLSAYTMGGGWIPIGSTDSQTTNLFVRGNNHVISGMTIRSYQLDGYLGLFGVLYNPSIVDLHLRGVDIDVGIVTFIGMLAGYISGGGKIYNCSAEGSICADNTMATGGLIGIIANGGEDGSLHLEKLSAAGSIEMRSIGTRDPAIGGIAGSIYMWKQHISELYTNVDIVSGQVSHAGGLFGFINLLYGGSVIQNCYSRGSISTRGYGDQYVWNCVGGLFGGMRVQLDSRGEGETHLLQNCYAAGTLEGNYTGGIIGSLMTSVPTKNPPDKNATVTFRNVVSLAESVTGTHQAGRFMGRSEFDPKSSGKINMNTAADVYAWDGTVYRQDGTVTDKPTGDQSAHWPIKPIPLTTEQVLGRWDGKPASDKALLFSDRFWNKADGWSARELGTYPKNGKGVGRLPTLTMGGKADKHIDQIGDVPLYISMKNPAYIKDFSEDTTYPGRLGIYGREDLDRLRTVVEQCAFLGSVHLARDIDMERTGFIPIGHAGGNPFIGSFDGHGHVIKNLFVDISDSSPTGLFARANDIAIRNLGLVDPLIHSGLYTGGLVGEISGSGLIENCFVSASNLQPNVHYPASIGGRIATGGLVGYFGGAGGRSLTIRSCYTAINVTGWGEAGGLVGTVAADQAKVDISDVFVAGRVSGAIAAPGDPSAAGGLIGGLNAGDTAIRSAVILSPSIESPSSTKTSWFGVGANRESNVKDEKIQVLAQTRSRGVEHGSLTIDQISALRYSGVTATLAELHQPSNWRFSSSAWTHTAGKTPVLKGFDTYRQRNYLAELIVPVDALTKGADGWYEIHSMQDWLTMCNMVNNLIVPYSTEKYRLMADVDLGTDLFALYQPVGQGSPFCGEFDGNGKTVTFGQRLLSGGGGLFGVIGGGGTVHDLTVEADIDAGGAAYLGGLAGQAEAGSQLQNITVTGAIRASSIYRVGGVVGDSAGTVENCVNKASVTLSQGSVSFRQAGGIAGRQRGGVITGCRSEGLVSADSSKASAVGGLVGSATLPQTSTAPTLENSQNTGYVSGGTTGGLIGEMTGGFVRGCASAGDVNGRGDTGGLVGHLNCPAGTASRVTDCYVTGAVTGNTVGGLFGHLWASNATKINEIARCYATGRVIGTGDAAGGAVGRLGCPVNKANLVLSSLAALNPQVFMERAGLGIGAFAGFLATGQPVLANVYTFDEMVLPKGMPLTKPSGIKACGKEDFASIAACKAFWNEKADFDGVTPSQWDSSGGEGAEIKLPTLPKLGSEQDGELPMHLRTFARPGNGKTTLTLEADQTELWSPKEQDATVVFTAKITGTTQTAVNWSCSDSSLTATGGADKDGNPICTLTIPKEYKDSYSGGELTVTATLLENSAIADSADITVKARQNAQAPVLTAQPADTATVVGKPATLNVTAQSKDGGTLSYQWYKTDLPDKDGVEIDGATGASYEAPATQSGISYYYCVITNTIADGEGIGNTKVAVRSAAAEVKVTKDAQQALTIVGGNRIVTYGDEGFTLQTSGGSGTGMVTWKSSGYSVVSVDDNGAVTIQKAYDFPVTITATKAGDDRYEESTAQITITVNKAKLTVKADDKEQKYGDWAPFLTFTYSGFVKGEDESVLWKKPIVSCKISPDSPVGQYPITVKGGEAQNYWFDYQAGTMTVTKAGQTPLTILQGSQIDKSYGDAPFTLSVTGGSGSGAVRWESSDETVASVDQFGKVTIHKAGSATITVIKAADGSYVEAKASTIITVKKAVLTVTAANAEKQYGEANPELRYEITGFVNGESKDVLRSQPAIAVDSTVPEKELPVGSYVIKVSGGVADNYAFTYNNATLIVNKADQSTFQIEGGNPTKAYGDAPFTLNTKNGAGGAVTWQSGDETVATVDEVTGKITIVGAGKIQITAISAETGNFAQAVAAVTLTVKKAKLHIMADPQTRVYGDENPAFTYTVEGFVNGDNEADLNELPVLTAGVDKTTGVGKYAIRLAGGRDDNYEYILNNAELVITPRPVTIQADDKQMTEGDDTPELTWTVTEGNLLEGDTLEGSLKVDGISAGKHPITQDTPFANPNYAVTFLSGTLTVAEKPKEPVISKPLPIPPTGDNFPIWPLWAALLALFGFRGTLLTARRRKFKNR